MEIDLNLENYDLEDLLKLFKLPYSFGEEELKSAKKIVLQTHPDKSKLPKEYFLFFSSAYKVIYSIHEFRSKSNCPKSTEYTVEEDREKALLLKDLTKKKDFNKIFNEMFEKHNIKDKNVDTGYGEWLKSDEDIETRVATKQNMASIFEEKKRETRAIIVNNGIQEMGGGAGGYDNLTDDVPDSYGSGIFSSLPYEDLRKAHRESVIPVTQEDYDIKPKYGSVTDLQMSRSAEDTKPKSFDQAKEYLQNKQDAQDKQDVQRAYRLAKRDEEVKKTNDLWMSSFKQLTNT
tara:strand:- start:1003 stop:1869 length:867 start_codon:yes stop_codon:yes gene_type:complete